MMAVAGCVGTVLGAWAVAQVERTSPGVIASFGNDYASLSAFAAPRLELRVLLFAAAATLGTTVLFALAPALYASGADLVPALKEDDRGGGRNRALAGLVGSAVSPGVRPLCAARARA